jgi:beta-lactam-binding protein with PASTA domain
MPLGRRVWGVGKVLLLLGALAATFLFFFFVSMRVAIRAGQVQIPDLTNMTVEDATRTLHDLELRPRIEDARRPDAKIAAGRVAQQEPPAGEAARPQRTVKVWVSAGPRTTPVPALVGQT